MADLVAALVGAGVRVRAVEPVRQNLEDDLPATRWLIPPKIMQRQQTNLMSLFLLQFWHELTKLFARKRTFIGFGAFSGWWKAGGHRRENRPGPREMFRRAIESNGFGFESYFPG